MVQHKDLMKFPLQFWLGLLCYCCGTQSTSILPVLLLGGCGGYSCHLSWSAYIYPGGCVSEPSFLPSASPRLFLLWMDWSLPPNLPPLFERLLVRVAWMLQSVQGVVLVFCCCHLRFPGAACSQGGRARLCLTFCICVGHVSSPKRLTRLIGGAFLDGWLRRIREHLLLLGACWLRFFLLRLLCIPDSCLSSKWCSLISETKWPKIATLRSENKLPKIYSTI